MKMNSFERVSINNIVIRFMTSKDYAKKIADITGMKIYQFGDFNLYVLSYDITKEYPEIHDATGLILSSDCQTRFIDSKTWINDFLKNLIEV